MTTYTTPHNLPIIETTDLIAASTDGLRQDLNAISTAANAALDAGLGGKENTIPAGTTAQYRRGDKTWQTLNSAAIPDLKITHIATAKPVTDLGGTYPLGVSYFGTAETGWPAQYGVVRTVRWGLGRIVQTYSTTNGKTFTRIENGPDNWTAWNELSVVGHTHAAASTTVSGFMSATDKTNLNAALAKNTQQDSTLDNHELRVNDLEVLGGLAPGDVSDATIHNLLLDPASNTTAELKNQYAGKSSASIGVLGVGDPATPDFYQARVTVPDGVARTALRIDQKNTVNTSDAVKIVNLAPAYALKVDQTGATPFDTVNLNAPGGGAHTVLGVGGGNTTLSTVKITNSGAQTGGAVVAALGTDPARTAQIFGADNYGIGASFSAHQWNGANAPAFRAIYDAGYSHDARAIWIAANHTGGSIAYIENPSAQTSGQMVNLVQSNAASTAPIIQITNAGTGDHFTAPNFAVTQGGNIKATALFNFSSFNNSRLQLTSLGSVIDRGVADGSAVLRIDNRNASSTGDILQIQSATSVRARFTKAGHLAVRTNTAPADADLVANEAALWFDPANGAAKIMWKAKQADGTIRTGALNLA